MGYGARKQVLDACWRWVARAAALAMVVTVALGGVRAAENAPAAVSQTVEAEGVGATKSIALQNAWSEAVRQGVGMFIVSKSELEDDRFTEKIVSHCRGVVTSYKKLEERQADDGWHVKIRAEIDQEMLRESVQAVSGQSVTVDGSNAAANLVTLLQNKKSAEEIWKQIDPLLDFSGCLKYRFSIEKIKLCRNTEWNKIVYPEGTDFIFGCHLLTVDVAKFEQQKRELERLISVVALERSEIQNNLVDKWEEYIEGLRRVAKPNYRIHWEWYRQKPQEFNYYSDTAFSHFNDYEVNSRLYGQLNKGSNTLSFDNGVEKFNCYKIDRDVYSLRPKYSVRFYIKFGKDENETILRSTVCNWFTVGMLGQEVVPALRDRGSQMSSGCFIAIQPLMELTPEQLMDLNNVDAGYTIKRNREE